MEFCNLSYENKITLLKFIRNKLNQNETILNFDKQH